MVSKNLAISVRRIKSNNFAIKEAKLQLYVPPPLTITGQAISVCQTKSNDLAIKEVKSQLYVPPPLTIAGQAYIGTNNVLSGKD
jgi:hypothetical protein